MFEYSDPSGTALLRRLRALDAYRAIADGEYERAARVPGSAFTWLEAFEGLARSRVSAASIAWRAFPVTSAASHRQIDDKRFDEQDEYAACISYPLRCLAPLRPRWAAHAIFGGASFAVLCLTL